MPATGGGTSCLPTSAAGHGLPNLSPCPALSGRARTLPPPPEEAGARPRAARCHTPVRVVRPEEPLAPGARGHQRVALVCPPSVLARRQQLEVLRAVVLPVPVHVVDVLVRAKAAAQESLHHQPVHKPCLSPEPQELVARVVGVAVALRPSEQLAHLAVPGCQACRCAGPRGTGVDAWPRERAERPRRPGCLRGFR